MGTGQLGVHFVTPTVPVSSRPIHLVRNGCPLVPLPSSNVLSGRLPETVGHAWSDMGSQYVAKQSVSKAPATITAAAAEVSQNKLDEVEKTILEIKEAEVHDDEDDPSVEGILDMEVDEEDSCDDISPDRYFRLDLERKAEPRPVLETANRVKETFRNRQPREMRIQGRSSVRTFSSADHKSQSLCDRSVLPSFCHPVRPLPLWL